MASRLSEKRQEQNWLVMLVLAVFVGAGMWQYGRGSGDDLAVSYLGCRVVASGHAAQLYSYSPGVFASLADDASAWKNAASESNFKGFLHPYVQTPLWAYALRPLCTRVSYRSFYRLFTGLTMLCFAGSLWLIAARWAPALLNPFAMGLICVLLWFSEPFRYAMFLMQTHILFLFLVLVALAWERRRPGVAGLLLAVATAVKITPGFLLIYWVMTRRWRAVASMVVWSVVLVALTVAVAGRPLVAVFLADLHRIGETLLVSINNQSFAAWCMGRFYPTDEIYDSQIFPLPTVVRVGSMALLVACTVVGGWLDRRAGKEAAPLGAMLALVGATVFSPIAWTHYFIVLVAPLMLLAGENRVLRSKVLWGAVAVIAALNFQPVAAGIIDQDVNTWTLVRSHFYAGVLCLGALGYAALLRMRVAIPATACAPEMEPARATAA